MRILSMVVLLLWLVVMPANAVQYTAPTVPDSTESMIPDTQSFGEGLLQMIQEALVKINPEIHKALKIAASSVAAVVLVAAAQCVFPEIGDLCELIGIAVISSLVLTNASSMIHLGAETVTQITTYGKLLLPVLTAALAAQGAVSTSAALYAGTALFNGILSSFLSNVLRPLVYCYLAFSVSSAACGETVLKNLRDMVKSFSGWCLKIMLTVFTTYMSITGVISGTTDAAALKATKVTISTFVPVVGSILSDASEAVLLSAGIAGNAAGIYGIFAVLAIFLVPFLKIGVHYLVLKGTFVVCGIFSSRGMGTLLGDFSTAMGLLLAMTGSVCLIQLISTVCFLKGVG